MPNWRRCLADDFSTDKVILHHGRPSWIGTSVKFRAQTAEAWERHRLIGSYRQSSFLSKSCTLFKYIRRESVHERKRTLKKEIYKMRGYKKEKWGTPGSESLVRYWHALPWSSVSYIESAIDSQEVAHASLIILFPSINHPKPEPLGSSSHLSYCAAPRFSSPTISSLSNGVVVSRVFSFLSTSTGIAFSPAFLYSCNTV